MFDKVRGIISSLTGIHENEISQESTIDQLHMNSLDVEELVLTLEDEFDVIFPGNTEYNGVEDIMAELSSQLSQN